ncbi:MAG: endo-1,4-beta-xylanase [Balneolaceae bacterium]
MLLFKNIWIVLLFSGMVGSGCVEAYEQDEQESPELGTLYEDAFLMGAALNGRQITGEDVNGINLVKTHFNTITPENILKWENVHPGPDSYDFEKADQFVQFGEENEMFTVGHTLVWHSQTPDWVFQDEEGNALDRAALLERMKNHIHKVVGRYKGRMHGWDVVNEALNGDGSLRNTPWLEIIGEDYITKAFEYAHEADPDAELYYNDYSLEDPQKRDGAVRLMESLLEQGVPVTGVGTQGHFSLEWPSLEQAEETVKAFAGLGLDVMVTELDIDVLPAAMDYQGADVSVSAEINAELNPWPEALPDSMQQALAQRYAELFDLYYRHRNAITRITFWGVTDGDSWKNNWPVRGRTNYPLLFDRNWQPKPAFYAVAGIPE